MFLTCLKSFLPITLPLSALEEQEAAICRFKQNPNPFIACPTKNSNYLLKDQRMSMTQTQQPQTQQPVVVYPNSVSGGQAAPSSHSHSDGSFGAVFIVLAVIIVISAIACFLGRLCNRRMSSQTKPSKQKQKANHNFRPKERDIEFGFDGKIPSAKPAGHGDHSKRFKMPGNEIPMGFRSMPGNGDLTGFRMPGNGDPTGFRMPGNMDFKVEPKPVVDDVTLKAGA